MESAPAWPRTVRLSPCQRAAETHEAGAVSPGQAWNNAGSIHLGDDLSMAIGKPLLTLSTLV